jgi:DNA-binding MarR family transcriptional regulator
MTQPPAELARLLRRANRAVERQMMSAVAKAGLDMLQPQHLTVLRVLAPDSDGTRISELANDADVTRQAIQQIVVQLEQLGIVEKIADDRDGRARLIRYTQSGRAGYIRCMQAFAEIERDYERQLGKTQTRAVKNALRTLAGDSTASGRGP